MRIEEKLDCVKECFYKCSLLGFGEWLLDF